MKLNFQLLGDCSKYKNLSYSELRAEISEINTLKLIFNLQNDQTITFISYVLFILTTPFAIWLLCKSRMKLKVIIEAESGAIYNETYNLVSVLII